PPAEAGGGCFAREAPTSTACTPFHDERGTPLIHSAPSQPSYLTPAQAGRLIPSTSGRGVSPQTITRLVEKGSKARNGGRIKLRAVRTPAGWRTTAEWVGQFLDSLTVDRVGKCTPSPTAEARAHRAEMLLTAEGW